MDLNQIGLILNILGTILIFKYGLPSRVDDDPNQVHYLIRVEKNKDDSLKAKNNNKVINILSNIGIVLIIIGFILQFLSTI